LRHLRRTLLVLGLVASCAPAAADAKNTRVVPAHRVVGVSGGELIGQGFARGYARPAGESPSPCGRLGPKDKVFVVSTTGETTTCTIKPGTPVFIFGLGGACSNVEPAPFFGEDEAAQRECAEAFTEEFVQELRVSVDGEAPVDIRTDAFELFSPQMTFQLPPDNGFGIPPRSGTLVAVTYSALIRGLPPGQHTIVIDVVTPEFAVTTTMIINVVPGV
jgi:hypothetical protein